MEDASECEAFMEHSGSLCSALTTLLAAPAESDGSVEGWGDAALVAACVSHLPAMRAQLWEAGISRRTAEVASAATAEGAGTALQLRSGWLYTAARCVVEAEETDAREPPRSIVQRIETSTVAAKEECENLWERADQLHRRHNGRDIVVGESAANIPAEDGLSDADRQLQHQQIVRDAANIDLDSLRHASSLPTLLKLFGIPQLRDKATRTICRIALRTAAPDTRTAMQKRMQQAAAKAVVANGLWQRPKTMTDILEEANRVVQQAADGAAERVTKVNRILDAGKARAGVEGGEDATLKIAPVTKSELTALLQKHVTWGFVGGSDRFRVHVRRVITTTPEGELQVLPTVEKRGPEHAIGEHHVSVAIWGKPGDVGEPPAEAAEDNNKNAKKQVSKNYTTFNRFNSGRQLVDDGERLYKELQEMTQARLHACGIHDERDGDSGNQLSDKSSTKKLPQRKKDLSEMQGKPITTVTKQQMSKAIASVATALCVLQSEGRLGLVKLDIAGCDLENKAVASIGQILLSELGLWGGTDSASDGLTTMAHALLRSQQEGKLGPIKLRLVQCTLDEQAKDAFDQLEQVPPPPVPDSSPGEDYEAGGIPIRINDEWYRLGSYQARFAAADMLAESLGAKAAGIDLGDDGTLTRSEKIMIFSRFYKKHLPGNKRRGGAAAINLLVKRYRGAKFITLCGNMKRKYGESPLEMWEKLMGGAEERKRDLDHELAVIKAEEAHQIFLLESTEEHQTLLKLAQSFLRQQEMDDAGKGESGRLQNLRFHLQPFCAIWTVEGVPADPDGRSRDPAFGGRSYRVKGHEQITVPASQSAVQDVHADATHDAGRDGAPTRSTTVAHSNVFSGMESADGLEAQLRGRRQHAGSEQQIKADHHGHGEQGYHGYDGHTDHPENDHNRHREHHDNHHWQHNAEYKKQYYDEHRQKYSQSGRAALGFDLWTH